MLEHLRNSTIETNIGQKKLHEAFTNSVLSA